MYGQVLKPEECEVNLLQQYVLPYIASTYTADYL